MVHWGMELLPVPRGTERVEPRPVGGRIELELLPVNQDRGTELGLPSVGRGKELEDAGVREKLMEETFPKSYELEKLPIKETASPLLPADDRIGVLLTIFLKRVELEKGFGVVVPVKVAGTPVPWLAFES